MAETKRLAARFVETVKDPGTYADGDGLYLVVGAGGGKRWELIYFLLGRRRQMGLGKASAVSLADARVAAADARRLVAKGIDPKAERDEARAEAARAAGSPVDKTFGTFADKLVADLTAGEFRNAKHAAQWRMTLTVYAANLRDKDLDKITSDDVLAVLLPIWSTKPETASRLRGRIERVLDAATAQRLRGGENPARWRGNLKHRLAKRHKLTRGHHAAMPYADVPAFMIRLRQSSGMGALALEFAILTAARTGEVIEARKTEFDVAKALWIVPKERMKAGREHRVPLTSRAVEIVRSLIDDNPSEYLFGARLHKPLSNGTMTKALRTAGGEDFTVHGFRSSFRDWCGEETGFPGAVAEAALAHVVGDATERAYRRGDALAKRKKLMEAWQGYCLPETKQNVVPMRRQPAA